MTPEERKTWLAERRKGIGSSDAPAVCNKSPWASPLAVYLDKTGQLPDTRENAAMHWGTLLEPLIMQEYEDETGRKLEKVPLLRHPKRPWMVASLDRRVVGGERIVEGKTVGAFSTQGWGPAETDEVPDHVALQCQHQMEVSGINFCDVAALIGGQQFRIYHLERSDKVISVMLEIEEEFWDRIQSKRPPEPNWFHPSTPDLVKALCVPNGSAIELGTEEDGILAEYELASSTAKEAEGEKERAKAKLIYAMGAATSAVLPSGLVIERKEVKRKAYSVESSSYFGFRVKGGKRCLA